MDNNTLKLLGMTRNQIHNALMKEGLPPELRVAKMEHIMTLKRERRRHRLAQKVHDKMWAQLLKPLKYDLSNARVGLRLKSASDAPERYEAFDAYVTLMDKLLAGMQKMQMDLALSATPSAVAKTKNFPNNGEHWSDWVSDKTKQRIHTLFDAVPYTPRAKRFEPFKRRFM